MVLSNLRIYKDALEFFGHAAEREFGQNLIVKYKFGIIKLLSLMRLYSNEATLALASLLLYSCWLK